MISRINAKLIEQKYSYVILVIYLLGVQLFTLYDTKHNMTRGLDFTARLILELIFFLFAKIMFRQVNKLSK